jgi:catalase
MFAYPDAARYRLGVNYQFLPCNAPAVPVYSPYERDGLMNTTANYGGDPSYVNSALRPVAFRSRVGASGQADGGKHDAWVAGRVEGYASEVTDRDFEQPRAFWEMLAPQEGQQDHFVANVCGTVATVSVPEVREKTFGELPYLECLRRDTCG